MPACNIVQGMPYRAAVRAVAHPATPDPRISNRSCFGCFSDDDEGEDLYALEVLVERERRTPLLRMLVLVILLQLFVVVVVVPFKILLLMNVVDEDLNNAVALPLHMKS